MAKHTEATLKALDIISLRKLAKEVGVTTAGMKTPDVIKGILAKQAPAATTKAPTPAAKPPVGKKPAPAPEPEPEVETEEEAPVTREEFNAVVERLNAIEAALSEGGEDGGAATEEEPAEEEGEEAQEIGPEDVDAMDLPTAQAACRDFGIEFTPKDKLVALQAKLKTFIEEQQAGEGEEAPEEEAAPEYEKPATLADNLDPAQIKPGATVNVWAPGRDGLDPETVYAIKVTKVDRKAETVTGDVTVDGEECELEAEFSEVYALVPVKKPAPAATLAKKPLGAKK